MHMYCMYVLGTVVVASGRRFVYVQVWSLLKAASVNYIKIVCSGSWHVVVYGKAVDMHTELCTHVHVYSTCTVCIS